MLEMRRLGARMPSPDLETNEAADRPFVISDNKLKHRHGDHQTILINLFHNSRSTQRHYLVGLVALVARRHTRSDRVLARSAHCGHGRHVCRGRRARSHK